MERYLRMSDGMTLRFTRTLGRVRIDASWNWSVSGAADVGGWQELLTLTPKETGEMVLCLAEVTGNVPRPLKRKP